jgi:transposase
MSMGKRKRDRQPAMWVTATNLPTAASLPFYRRLNQLLREHGFDAFVEAQCAGFCAATMGRPSFPPPGIYFRLLLIGYFEGIDSERGIAWRAERPQLHLGTRSRTTELEEPSRGARCGVPQSSAHSQRTRPASAAASR